MHVNQVMNWLFKFQLFNMEHCLMFGQTADTLARQTPCNVLTHFHVVNIDSVDIFETHRDSY